ncbi:MAG: tRNA (adenosine(37)-N6)-threonylcarbamoyltransferase complex ATPase subunit type 1 TsaE [Bacteroidota bacterium]
MAESIGVFELEEIGRMAATLLDAYGNERIWLFYGDPGAGKTTLIRALVKALGVDPATVSSPTFPICNIYRATEGRILHFDLYRIAREAELYDLGMDEYLDSGDLCLIEWPERLGNLAPSRYFSVHLGMDGPDSRTIRYRIHD